MTFRVGQKVVCVDASDIKNALPLKFRAIYTIREVYYDEVWGVGISLCEVINPLYALGKEFGYRTRRFRPVVERKTSIEVFEKMLTSNRVDA